MISIKIPPLTASQKLQLHQEQKKQEHLKQQKRQLQLNLIDLKQATNTFQKLFNAINTKPNQQGNHFAILTNGQNLINLLTKITAIADQLVLVKADKLNALYESTVVQCQNLRIDGRVKEQDVSQQEIEKKIELDQGLIADMKQQINEIQQRLDQCRANSGPDLQDQVTEFVTELLANYPNDVSPSEIEMIKRLDFNALNLELVKQISTIKKTLQQVQSPITELRKQILHLHYHLSPKPHLDSQLQTNRQLLHKNHYILQCLIEFNNNLQANLQSQIEKEVEERKDMLNKAHMQSTDKYVMAGQYVVGGFRVMLGEDKYKQLRDTLFAIKSQAVGIRDRKQLRCEPMEYDI